MRKKVLNKWISLGVLTLLCLTTSKGVSQKTIEKKADKVYEVQAYVNAIEIYEKLAGKGYTNADMLKKLANSYYFNGKLAQANHWYAELFDGAYQDKGKEIIPSEYYYRYAQTLRAVENYEKANQMMEVFAVLEQQDSRARLFKSKKDSYLQEIASLSDRFELENISVNSAYSDFGAAVWKDQLVFTSARETENKKGKELHEWTNESYTALFRARIKPDGTYEEPHRLLPTNNARVNEATAVFTQDGKTMYFTRNNTTSSGKRKLNKDRTALLKIYRATLQENNQWGNIEDLPFNSDNFSTANPALTPDEKWLYFSSDREGTYGQSDIYRVPIVAEGGFGEVENLGGKINTEGRETFPFISQDWVLFFSSDGHPGLGGLDVFAVQINPDGSLGEIANMGAPINSSSDDFAIHIDTAENKGYVSSNRSGGVGGDDVYSFKEKLCLQTIEGTVADQDTQEALTGVRVTVYDSDYRVVAELESDARGNYSIANLMCKGKYRVKTQLEEYNTEEVVFELNDAPGAVTKTIITLEKTEKPVTKDDDLFKILNLKPIYFDFDKSVIRPDAAIEIMKVIEVLNSYPTMKIDVRSHTDSRGNPNYNLKLSDRRAKATVDWIVSQGVNPEQISGQGFGQTQPLIPCENGMGCTEEQHQLNRRSEFIILEL
ncbi:OmpA family protein [Myroides odoratimimus]|uniref:OmpA family protein n=1 Tax=Myroides odoratimimus TaxID=76832 RepID=UPI001CE13780|nr:OmpA family protein [Myroides odoratimimus]MCA4806972.1 OmpA family protein [Myroides odoratimimus]